MLALEKLDSTTYGKCEGLPRKALKPVLDLSVYSQAALGGPAHGAAVRVLSGRPKSRTGFHPILGCARGGCLART